MNGVQNGVVTGSIQLEDDFLQKLRDEIENRKICNYSIDVSIGSEKGDNYLGFIAKLRIDGTDVSGKKVTFNWIAKTAPKGELLRRFLDLPRLYAREIYVYEKLFPAFSKFQDERAVLKPFDSHANYVFSYLEQCSFVMEDMKSCGYVMKNRKEPLDYNHVKLVMEAYGKLHALSFALRDQQPEEFNKILEEASGDIFNTVPNDEETEKHRQELHCKIIKTLDPQEDAVAIEKYSRYMERDTEILENVMKTTNQYSIIAHGDSWVNNMLFKYENDNRPDRPTKVCLLDWQLSRYCSPALDLSYFIFTCTDKTLRDKHYDHMIKLYYHSLCQHLIDLGSDPEQLLPFSALQEELKKCSIFGMHMSAMLIHLMTSEVDEIPDFQNSDTNMASFNYQSVNHSLYQDRVRGIILDFVKYGYFEEHNRCI